MGYCCRFLFYLLGGALLFCASSEVHAQEVLEEGFSLEIKSGNAHRHRLESSIDLSIIPLPVPGGGRFNSTRITVGVGSNHDFSAVDLDKLHLQLFYWPHIRAFGVRRDRDQGLIGSIEIVGGSLPWVMVGKKESRNWIVGHIGIDLGYDWYRQSFEAALDGRAIRLEPMLQLSQQVDIFSRLSFRARQQVSYRGLLGHFSDREGWQLKNQLQLKATAGLYLDLTRAPLYREVQRTNPATQTVTTRRFVNQGKRWRWIILRASTSWHPVGDILGLPFSLHLATGLEHKF